MLDIVSICSWINIIEFFENAIRFSKFLIELWVTREDALYFEN